MEHATPLQSLYDMYDMLKYDKNPGIESREFDQQVVQFVSSVSEILERDRNCDGKYRFVTVADVHRNLADIMVREIMDVQISMKV